MPPAEEIVHSEEVSQTIRTMSFGTLWRMLRYPFILLALALIPRQMGDADYGVYAYFVSLFVLFNTFTDLGFLQAFGLLIPESEADGRRERTLGLFHGLSRFGMLLAVLMVFGIWGSFELHPWGELRREWVALLCILLVMHRAEALCFNFLYGLNHIARFSAKEMLRSALTLVLVLLLYARYGLAGAFLGLVCNELILLLIGGWWVRDFLRPAKTRLPFSELKHSILFGARFFLPALLLGLLQRAGNVYVKIWSGSSEEVAYYDIANQYLILTTMFIGLILQTLLPSLAKLKATNQAEAMERWQRVVMAYCAILGFLSVNALAWIGEPLILLWLGESFAPVVEAARVISIAIPPSILAFSGMNLALLARKPLSSTAAVGLGILTMTVAAYLLVPERGALGGSWATVAGYMAMGGGFLFQYRRRFRPILPLFWIALLLGGALTPLYLLPVEGWMRNAAGFVLSSLGYAVLLVLFRVITFRDIRKLLKPFQKGSAAPDDAD